MRAIYFLLITGILLIGSLSKAPVYTQVTYLYDINRGEIQGAGSRSFQYYKKHFEKLLKTDCNLIVYGEKQVAQFVWQRREQHNTVFIERPLAQFQKYWFSPLIQKVRLQKMANSSFVNRDNVAFTLEYYSVLKMGKLFIMQESLKYDKFNSDILIWVDAAFTHNFPEHINVFSPENTFKKLYQFLQPQWLLLGYGESSVDLDGYAEGELRYIDRKLKKTQIVLGGHQGGYVQIVKDMKSAFQNFLKITLQYGDLSAQEAILSMMQVKFPYLIPITTVFYLKQMIEKIRINEDINKKPSHSRSFGCKLSAENIQIKYDCPISKANILGAMPTQIQKQASLIGQTLTKPIRITDRKQALSDKLKSSKQQFYLHIIIMILLTLSYGYMHSIKRSFQQLLSLRRRKMNLN